MRFILGLHFLDTLDPLLLRFHPFPFAGDQFRVFFTDGRGAVTLVEPFPFPGEQFHPFLLPGEQTFGHFGQVIGLLIVPPLLVAAIQSYRLFRREAYDRFSAALRPLLQVALAALVFAAALALPPAFVTRASHLSFQAWWDANKAIAKLPPDMIPVAASPTQLSVEDLSKVAPLSEEARIVLRGAAISANRRTGRGSYVTAIRFGNGLSCTINFISRYHCERRAEK
jgi:hypothetical protein